MTVKKICLFAALSNQYGVIDDFVQQLADALTKLGVQCLILRPERDKPREFLDQLLQEAPDCTLSFNGLLPDHEGRFLCDLIKIPHVALLTDAPHYFFPLIQSPLNILGSIDQQFAQTFRDLNFPHSFFLPHAASSHLIDDVAMKKKFDVLMLNSFIDYEAIAHEWKTNYSQELNQILHTAAQKVLSQKNTTCMQAFIETMDQAVKDKASLDLSQINYPTLLDELENYVVGLSRIQFLKAVSSDISVHVFGRTGDSTNWSTYLAHYKNVHIHKEVPFTEAIQLMRQAKILVNCVPKIKYGAHERIFNGILCGAAVLTLESHYIDEYFIDGEDILTFSLNDKIKLQNTLQFYLNDEEKRSQLVEKGKQKVKNFHTWDQRARTLLKEINPLVDQLKNRH